MHWVLFLMLSSVACFSEEEPVMLFHAPENSSKTRSIASAFERDVKGGRLREKTNMALNAVIRLAVYKLKRDGHVLEADALLSEWQERWDGYIERRGITDHRPLSAWLAEKTYMLEIILGKETMHLLRLDDLITINFALPIVFGCVDDVNLEEFGNHFVFDTDYGYRGLGPVIVYWTSFFSCVGFTWGTGFLFCGPIAMGAEMLTLKFVAPRLNEPLWRLSCGKYSGQPIGLF